MKKLILTFVMCFLAVNAKAYTVDELYSDCISKSHNTLKCLYYFYGFVQAYTREKPHSYFERCNEFSTGQYIERFIILYRRNFFKINTSSYHAIIESIQNLCPENDDEKKIIQKQLDIDPFYQALEGK